MVSPVVVRTFPLRRPATLATGTGKGVTSGEPHRGHLTGSETVGVSIVSWSELLHEVSRVAPGVEGSKTLEVLPEPHHGRSKVEGD